MFNALFEDEAPQEEIANVDDIIRGVVEGVFPLYQAQNDVEIDVDMRERLFKRKHPPRTFDVSILTFTLLSSHKRSEQMQ